MLMMLRKKMKRDNNQNGFTLIELIIVMAIMAILAGIAVPKYTGIQNTAKVKADGSTAMNIIKAARLQEDATGTPLTKIGDLSANYMVVPATQSGGTFALSKSGDNYEVKWTATVTGYAKDQTVTENTMSTWKPVEG